MEKMGFVSLSGKVKEITSKSCKTCKHYKAFTTLYTGDCGLTERTTMQNDVCGCFEKKAGEING